MKIKPIKKKKLRMPRNHINPYLYFSEYWEGTYWVIIDLNHGSEFNFKQIKKTHEWLGKAIAYIEQEKTK